MKPSSLGIISVIENWEKMPQALFAKAWITTGHITPGRSLEISGLTEEDMANSHLLTDPLSLDDILGAENAEGPSIEDLVSGGRAKRRRVVWMMHSKDSTSTAMMPGCLIMPVEKHLSNYLFAKVSKADRQLKPVVTIVMSKRSGKEASNEMLRKHTVVQQSGLRRLRPNATARSTKDGLVCAIVLYRETVGCTLPHFHWGLVSSRFHLYIERRWRNSHVLVHHSPLLHHIWEVAPSTFTTVKNPVLQVQ